jgi:thiosulfate/3-mercaptopyruvate sulfurtransferase
MNPIAGNRAALLRAAALSVALCFASAAARRAGAQDTPNGRDPRAALLVTPAWLAQHLKDPDLVLLHVGDPKEYPAAHIPGARLVTQRDVSVSDHDMAKNTGLTLELPNADTLRARLAALGISDRSRIVVYYGNDWVTPSTRVILTLDHAGLGARTSLLDGGMQAWKAAGHPVTAEPAPTTVGTLSPLRTRQVTVDAAWVRSHIGAPGTRIIDARDPVFYDGIEATPPRKGHIPSARSIPYGEIAHDDLTIKSTSELAALFAKAGVGARDTVVAYCHIGQQGTAIVFAARALGHPVYLYDGSFQEWSRRTELPVELPTAGAPAATKP